MIDSNSRIEQLRAQLKVALPGWDDIDPLCDLALRGLEAQWVSVEERLPSTEHLVWSLLDGDAVAEMDRRFYDGKVWRYLDGSESDLRVSHWMPLPPAPEEKPC